MMVRLTIYIIVFILFILGNKISAQKIAIDSLESLLSTNINDSTKVLVFSELAREYAYISSEKSIYYGLKAKELALEINFIRGKANALRNIATTNSIINNYVESNRLLNEAIQLFDSLGDQKGLGNCYISLGTIHIFQEEFLIANKYHYKALEIFRQLKIKERMGVLYNNISFSYMNRNQFEKSLIYMDSSYFINSKLSNEPILMANFRNYGLIYKGLGNIKKSTLYFEKVIALSEKLKNKSNAKAACSAYIELSKILKKTNPKLCINYLNKAIEISNKKGLLQKSINAYLLLYKIYVDQGKISLADYAIDKYIQAKDSLLEQSLSQRTKAMEAIFLTKSNELKIQQLSKDKTVQNELIAKQKILLSLSVVIVVITIIFIAYFYKSNSARKKINDKLLSSFSELKSAKLDAEKANISKTQFLANMSHEIRSPLNAIVGFSQIIANESAQFNFPENLKDMLKHIIHAGKNLSELINNILDLSKIEYGKMELNLETLNVVQILQGIYHINKESADKKDLNYNFKYAPDIPKYIISDRTKLNQILMNLVSNAIKFTSNGRSVLIEMQIKKESILIKVIDEGIGISSDRIDKIFDAFEQADNSITRKFGGTGLGLAITKKMVQMLEGSIRVESIVDKGSTFYVEIPIIKANDQVILDVEWTATDLGILEDNLVLVAEDIELNQILLRNFFEGLNIRYEFADNGIEVIEKSKQLQPNLILMDIHMPDMDGMQATEEIRKIAEIKDTPIVALSADAFLEQQNKALELGFNDYITKPIDLNKLSAVLGKYLVKKENHVSSEQKNKILEEKIQSGLEALLKIPLLELKQFDDKIMELKKIEGVTSSPFKDSLDKIENLVFAGKTSLLKQLIKNELKQFDSVK